MCVMQVCMQDVRYRRTESEIRQQRLQCESRQLSVSIGSTDCTGVAKLTEDGRKNKNIHPDDKPIIHKWPPLVARPVSRLVQQREAMLIHTPRPVCLLPCGVMQTGCKYEIPQRRDAREREARRRTMIPHIVHL